MIVRSYIRLMPKLPTTGFSGVKGEPSNGVAFEGTELQSVPMLEEGEPGALSVDGTSAFGKMRKGLGGARGTATGIAAGALFALQMLNARKADAAVQKRATFGSFQ